PLVRRDDAETAADGPEKRQAGRDSRASGDSRRSGDGRRCGDASALNAWRIRAVLEDARDPWGAGRPRRPRNERANTAAATLAGALEIGFKRDESAIETGAVTQEQAPDNTVHTLRRRSRRKRRNREVEVGAAKAAAEVSAKIEAGPIKRRDDLRIGRKSGRKITCGCGSRNHSRQQ